MVPSGLTRRYSGWLLIELQQVEVVALVLDALSASVSIGLPEFAFGSQ